MTDKVEKLMVAAGMLAVLVLLAFATSTIAFGLTKGDKRKARAECRLELRSGTYADFVSEWGRPRPFRRCVRVTAREFARERIGARRSCIQEMNAAPLEFAQEYPGPHPLRTCIRQELI
jgi:hypothetical protein